MIRIPLNSNPEQLFSIVLGGESYDLRVKLNSRTSVWSVSFSQKGVDIVTGVSLLGGVDMLHQYNLPISNMYTVNIDDSKEEATSSNLGTAVQLFILTDEEVTNG